MKVDCFVSVVVPLNDDEDVIETFIEETIAVLRGTYSNFELVLVDDGSSDSSVSKVSRLLERIEGIRLLRLSREFGEEIAIAAGLDSVIGDFTVVMLPHMDPPDLIPELVSRCMAGTDVIYGVRSNRSDDRWLMRKAIAMFYWYCRNALKLDLAENATQFRCMSRQAVNAIIQIRDTYRYLRLFSTYVGFKREELLYSPLAKGSRTRRRSFSQSLSMAMGIIMENSAHPLRFISWIGLLAALGNVIYVVYIVAVYFLKEDIMQGWTTLSLQNAGQFFFVSIILTALCEYMGRVLNRLQNRPLYYLMGELNSNVLLIDRERRNVVEEARRIEG